MGGGCTVTSEVDEVWWFSRSFGVRLPSRENRNTPATGDWAIIIALPRDWSTLLVTANNTETGIVRSLDLRFN